MALSLRRQFGIRLKAIRQERKLTQEQVAGLVGISVDFLSLIERGRNAPSFEVLERMARKLDFAYEGAVRLQEDWSEGGGSLTAISVLHRDRSSSFRLSRAVRSRVAHSAIRDPTVTEVL